MTVAQPRDTHMKSVEKDVAAGSAHRLHDLIKEFHTAMLVTHEGGELRSRPMAIAEVGSDNDIWFSTSLQSPKTEEIRKNPRVLVTMQDSTRFVSVGGSCVVSQDRAHIARLWNDSWRIWFPKGKEDPAIVLVRVRVESGEFWDLHGKNGIRFLWEAAKAYFSGEKVEAVPEVHGSV